MHHCCNYFKLKWKQQTGNLIFKLNDIPYVKGQPTTKKYAYLVQPKHSIEKTYFLNLPINYFDVKSI